MKIITITFLGLLLGVMMLVPTGLAFAYEFPKDVKEWDVEAPLDKKIEKINAELAKKGITVSRDTEVLIAELKDSRNLIIYAITGIGEGFHRAFNLFLWAMGLAYSALIGLVIAILIGTYQRRG